ncbi:MAG: hypothetical protein NZ533_00845 [Casimicrobiaceae bacterium]|nr:hypothetical protein [Casimicrobiaceae bacterium]MDW8312404.1 hypothetical protein [Burkholderiales bacterium]
MLVREGLVHWPKASLARACSSAAASALESSKRPSPERGFSTGPCPPQGTMRKNTAQDGGVCDPSTLSEPAMAARLRYNHDLT